MTHALACHLCTSVVIRVGPSRCSPLRISSVIQKDTHEHQPLGNSILGCGPIHLISCEFLLLWHVWTRLLVIEGSTSLLHRARFTPFWVNSAAVGFSWQEVHSRLQRPQTSSSIHETFQSKYALVFYSPTFLFVHLYTGLVPDWCKGLRQQHPRVPRSHINF